VTTEPHSSERDELRHRLYELMDDSEVSLEAKQRRAVELGRQYVGVTTGHIQRRDPDGTAEVIVSVGEQPTPFTEGAVLDRSETYCRRTIESHSPLALSNVPEQGWADDPAYEEHGIGCYLGTTIFVDREVYGTVCFTSAAPRETPFSADEKAFVELIARLLGRAIEAETYEQRLETLSTSQQRSERKYEALLDLAPNAIFVVDAETGTIETANSRAATLTGYTAAELKGMSVLDLHSEADRERYAQLLGGGFDERVQERFDDGTPLEINRSDGTVVPVELGLSKVEIDDHTVMLGIVRDISDRRERERELTRQRELFEQTQEAIGLGGWELDIESGNGRWTDEVYRIFGLSPDSEITVEDALGAFHPDDQQTMAEALERLTTEGDPFDLELRIQPDEGDVRWVHTIGRPRSDDIDADGTPSSVFGIIREITGRKDREQTIRVKDQAIEESMVGITIADATKPNTPIVYANAGFERMTGYSMEEARGRNCRFLQGERTDEETVDEIREAVDAERPIQTEILNYRANGTPFWNELTISPVMGSDGRETSHFVGIQNDITGQKRRERLIEVLDRVLRHNLRNEMNVVIGFSEAIANRTDGDVADMATRLKGTATELISLSNKVRSFETGVTEEKSLELRELDQDVRTVVEDLDSAYPDTEFRVTTDGNGTVLATDQLMLALEELGDNAAKYGDGTAVCYEIVESDHGEIQLHVSDSGPGLPPTERQVLESGRETPLEHGSGLGLWMVNWIVTGLGGTVTATIKDGTTVTLSLPAADAEIDPTRRSPISEPAE